MVLLTCLLDPVAHHASIDSRAALIRGLEM
jgi:hypothetical protein